MCVCGSDICVWPRGPWRRARRDVYRSDLALIAHCCVLGLIDMIMIGALFIRAVSVICLFRAAGNNTTITDSSRVLHRRGRRGETDVLRTESRADPRSWSLIIWKRLRCSVFICHNYIISTQQSISINGCGLSSKLKFDGTNRWILKEKLIWKWAQTNVVSIRAIACKFWGLWQSIHSYHMWYTISRLASHLLLPFDRKLQPKAAQCGIVSVSHFLSCCGKNSNRSAQ